jgi:hypothetical protein
MRREKLSINGMMCGDRRTDRRAHTRSGRQATINLRLAAVRRVAYEAADAGLLSPELAAGIAASRVSGASASVSVLPVATSRRAWRT